ncbi:MAG: GreA/GreB family elongation factor [Opitutus sp.]
MNKIALRDRIVAQLRTELALQTRAAQLSREEAISEESKPENQYDMHSQEAAYLAEGQARLAAEIAENIALYEGLTIPAVPPDGRVALGAVVAVEHGGRKTWYFIGPRAGGLELEHEGTTVLVLTPQSPLGRELIGKRVTDSVRVQTRTGFVTHHIAAVE